MPTTILLIRHGQTPTTGTVLPGRAPGLHLSEKGQEQARKVSEGIEHVDAIYTSPLERTQETAAPLAEKFKIEPLLDDALLEADFGTWTGEKLADLAKLPEWETVQKTPSQFRFPGGESFAEMQDRIVAGLERIAAAHPGQVVACFSHADPIKAALTHFAGKPLDEFQRPRRNQGPSQSLSSDARGL
ncbi:histidine phosphatase family protein [Corynebacterium aquatimens]|uniref:histidine phosphatase family protein n=1 Tax=Corynebacterium aquatimens TaxID=1190508 RepID=UPI002541777B|nr:histidine phosphatase family protein [Corynebacterium aquatimens]QYH20438.1 histidine phosphatase family protein [Corynebacterium aquatimens]